VDQKEDGLPKVGEEDGGADQQADCDGSKRDIVN
jgi:hypothetical protein